MEDYTFTAPIIEWSLEKVLAWLSVLHAPPQTIEIFRYHDFDGHVLLICCHDIHRCTDDFASIGIPRPIAWMVLNMAKNLIK